MPRLILLLILLALLAWAWVRLRRKYGRRLLEPTIIIVALGGLLALVAAGKLHWIGVALAASLAALRPLLPWLWRLLPTMLGLWRRRRGRSGDPTAGAGPMSRAQALAVLGVGEDASREEIVEAHRRLIQKLHPDRKGSSHLSRVVNQARDTLLD